MMLTSPGMGMGLDFPPVPSSHTSCSPWNGDIKFLVCQEEKFLQAMGWLSTEGRAFFGGTRLFSLVAVLLPGVLLPPLPCLPFYGAPS